MSSEIEIKTFERLKDFINAEACSFPAVVAEINFWRKKMSCDENKIDDIEEIIMGSAIQISGLVSLSKQLSEVIGKDHAIRIDCENMTITVHKNENE